MNEATPEALEILLHPSKGLPAVTEELSAFKLNKFLQKYKAVSYEVDNERDKYLGPSDDAAREERFANWNAKLKHLGAQKMNDDGFLPSVKPYSEEWNAWKSFLEYNGFGTSFMERQAEFGKEWTVVSKMPPREGMPV